MKKYLIMYAIILMWLVSFPFVINKTVNGSFAFTDETEGSLIGITSAERTSAAETSATGSEAEISLNETEKGTEQYDPFTPLKETGDMIVLYDKEKKNRLEISVEYYTAHIVSVFCFNYDLRLSKEALKALCISVRTKALYDNITKGNVSKEDVSFYSFDIDDRYVSDILSAVKDTKSKVITYEGEIANALYHLSSPGKTETYKNLYSKDIPYLSGVPSPDENSFPLFYGRKELSADEFKNVMETAFVNVKLEGDHCDWISDIPFDNCLRCRYLVIGNEKISGTSFMKVFSLNSTCIMVSTTENGFVFSTEGYGHGLGLSVYGAEIMAQQGKDHTEILTHYYTGVAVDQFASLNSEFGVRNSELR